MNISIIPLWVKILIPLLIIGAWSYFCYDLGYDKKDLEHKTAILKEKDDQKKREDALRKELSETSEKLQNALSNIKTETVYVDRVVTKEIEKPVYGQCIVPDTGVELMRENADRLNNLRVK